MCVNAVLRTEAWCRGTTELRQSFVLNSLGGCCAVVQLGIRPRKSYSLSYQVRTSRARLLCDVVDKVMAPKQPAHLIIVGMSTAMVPRTVYLTSLGALGEEGRLWKGPRPG